MSDIVVDVTTLGHTSETICVAPSGGRKGTKPVRYDLIPEELIVRGTQTDPPHHAGVVTRVRFFLQDFWERNEQRDQLEYGASAIQDALGGYTALRHHLARVYGAGAAKYDDNNWQKGYPFSWSYAAAMRHLAAVEEGEFNDPEFGTPHLAHVWFHLAALDYFVRNGVGTDDRPAKSEVKGE